MDDTEKKNEKCVSIGIWPERYREMLKDIVFHKSVATKRNRTIGSVLQEIISEEHKKTVRIS
jgi:hypothetical protein